MKVRYHPLFATERIYDIFDDGRYEGLIRGHPIWGQSYTQKLRLQRGGMHRKALLKNIGG